jgi:carbon-monoxide dehydrogenase iron sulfur subunit
MKKVYINEEVCIGCGLCEVHCRLQHSKSKDLLKVFKKELTLIPLARVERNQPISFSVQCRHCAEPSCVYACLTGALQQDPETGIVSVDTEKCIGCWTCILVCPFGIIRQDKSQKCIAKCDLCLGTEIPACVANCPNEALVFAEARDSKLG